jgi:hypothetical protein
MLVYTRTTALARFISHLDGGDFLFVLLIDGKNPDLKTRLVSEFSFNPNVFIVLPLIPRCWGCTSLAQAPLFGMKAVFRAGFECDWFSLHSETDVIIRSRQIVKLFFLRFRGRAEFFSYWPSGPGRVTNFSLTRDGCRPSKWLRQAEAAMRYLFPNWTQWSVESFVGGSQWWTLTRSSAIEILKWVESHPIMVKRMTFLIGGDEIWFQSIMRYLNFTATHQCSLRGMLWKPLSAHPESLTETEIGTFRSAAVLFARKMPEYNPALWNFVEERIRMEDNVSELPDILDFKRRCGMFEWKTMFEIRRNMSSS